MKTIIFSSVFILTPFIGTQAMVGHSINKQDQIMNRAINAISFDDVVRSIEPQIDGTYRITFQKHAAIYTLENFKTQSLLETLIQSHKEKKPIQVSIQPDKNTLIHVE